MSVATAIAPAITTPPETFAERIAREDRADRLRGALTLTGLVMVTVFLAMAMRVPEAALSCYILFFAHRDNAGDSIMTAVRLSAAATLAILLAIPLLNAVKGDPMLRLAAIAGFAFLGMFLSQASRLGPLAATAGFVFAFMLTLVDLIPVPELMSQAMRWMWVVLVLPLGLMAVWAALAGVRPEVLLRRQIARREAASDVPHTPEAQRLLDEGLARSDEWLKFARILGAARGADAEALARADDDSYFRLALAEAGAAPRASSGSSAPEKAPLFRPDAFSDPRHLRFALKCLVAVLITYGFYAAFNLFSIHTAMITVFYVALGSRGETHHRLALRLIGCLIGAVAGILVMTLLMPWMTDIGHLLIVTGAVTFVAAWIALGGERVSYAGWQMALCFYLVVLAGFSPPASIDASLSRIIGILFGSAVVWFVFTALWPVHARDDAQAALAELSAALASNPPATNGREVARLREPLARARRLAGLAVLERQPGLAQELAEATAQLHFYLRQSHAKEGDHVQAA